MDEQPADAPKAPAAPAQNARQQREAKLAQALRANLRRRKPAPAKPVGPSAKKSDDSVD
jgi:hypothetical protein